MKQVRGIGRLGVPVMATLGAVALGLAAGDAVAGSGARKARLDLEPPGAAADQDATGVVRVTRGKKSDRVVVKLRRLDARTDYEVRDLDTDASLGSVRTNRKGRARLRLRFAADAGAKSGAAMREVADGFVVIGPKGDVVLGAVGEDGSVRGDDGAPADTVPAGGFASYQGRDGSHATVELLSIPAARLELFGLSFEVPFDPDVDEFIEIHELFADTARGDDVALPLGVDGVRALSGRGFQIVDLRGAVWLRGRLPEVARLPMPQPPMMPPERPGDPGERPGTDPFRPGDVPGTNHAAAGAAKGNFPDPLPPFPGGWGGFPEGGPERLDPLYFLLIEDENGALREAGALQRFRFPAFPWDMPPPPDWRFPDCPMDGHGHGDDTQTDRPPTDRPPTDRPPNDSR